VLLPVAAMISNYEHTKTVRSPSGYVVPTDVIAKGTFVLAGIGVNVDPIRGRHDRRGARRDGA
jgi:hypothetical protein